VGAGASTLRFSELAAMFPFFKRIAFVTVFAATQLLNAVPARHGAASNETHSSAVRPSGIPGR